MDVVPVLDLKQGRVVRARRGDRSSYRPIETPLSATSDPLDVAAGLLEIHPFPTLYVADLDAIMGDGYNDACIRRLRDRFPRLRLWVDNGICSTRAARSWLSLSLGDLVLGSETQRDASVLRDLANDERIVLSLDFRGEAFQGPSALLEQPSIWPRRVIVMTLARVGSAEGPDLATLSTIRRGSEDRSYYAAGGVRDQADLVALSDAGVSGALVASALHDGMIGGPQLARFGTGADRANSVGPE